MQTAHIPEIRDARQTFGKNVKHYRELAHLSQFQLAADAEIDFKILSAIEKGTHNPTLLTIRRIADAVGVPPTCLLTEEPLPTTFFLSNLQT